MNEVGLTYKCNNNCIMCTIVRPTKRKEKTIQAIKYQINKLKNPEYILLTGGEPTLRKEFFSLLKSINKKHPCTKIKLITNARLFKYNSHVKKLKGIKNLLIITELHGTKNLHDKITETPGGFDQTIQGIKNLLENNFDVEIRFVLHKLNHKNILGVARLIKANFRNIKQLVIFPIDLIGNAYKNRKKLFVEYKKFVPYVEKTIDFLKNNFKVQLYHIPHCKINKKYHNYIIKGTVENRRLLSLKKCNTCVYKRKCPGIWKSYKNYLKS